MLIPNDFDRLTALHLALACQACYSGDADAIEAVLSIPADRVHTKSAGDQFVEVCLLDDCTLIVARGTTTLGGWATDADCRRRQFPEWPGLVHAGFGAAAASVLPWIESHVDRTLPVAVTGHSLGAALATLISAYLASHGHEVQPVYTFGSPRVGAAEFRDSYRPKQYRLVNCDDPVTLVPIVGYQHVGTAKWITEDGAIRPLGVWQLASDVLSRVGHANLTLAVDHDIASYVAALQSDQAKAA